MRREHFNNIGIAREYRNGNITLKYYPDGVKESKRDSVLALATLLDGIDCSFIGETYCISNYAEGHTVYNAYSNCKYVLNWGMIDELEAGKTIRLYALPIDDADAEILEQEGF